MRTTEITPVYWDPEARFPSGYESEINQFFTDVAADSGNASNFFSVLAQYYDTLDGGASYVNYHVTKSAPLTDGNSYPSGSGETCADPYEEGRPCISDTGLQNELRTFIEANNLPVGIGHEYVVYFPRGVDSCFGEGGANDHCAGTSYCAYHSAMAVGGSEVEYANEPENGDPAYGGGCDPQNVAEAQATINTSSHEISESVTDPLPGSGWYDKDLKAPEQEWGEIGDICAWTFEQGLIPGVDVIPNGGSNQSINGHSYLLQTEWDNTNNTCSVSAATAGTAPPTASIGVSPVSSVATGASLAFDGSGSSASAGYSLVSYSWDFGDDTTATGAHPSHSYASTANAQSQNYTVTLTVVDSIGQRASTTHTVTVTDRPPTAAFSPPAGIVAGSTTAFVAASSSDPDGSISSYVWNWGDGSADGSGPTASHNFTQPGTYPVTLTVTDNSGSETSISHSVAVAAATPPPGEIHQLTPPPNTQTQPGAQPGQGALGSKTTEVKARTSHHPSRKHHKRRKSKTAKRKKYRGVSQKKPIVSTRRR
jgi:PKD repeat protein